MNKIYRVIWSHVRHCYVVVSELTKRHSRANTLHAGSGSLAALAVVTLLCSTSFAAGEAGADSNRWGNENTSASGQYATAWGDGTTAVGVGGTAFGFYTEANGTMATAFGSQTTADGSYATAWGDGAKALEMGTTAIGFATTASGAGATAWGINTDAEGQGATAFGARTTSSGQYATAWGDGTTANGYISTAFGQYAKAYGNNSVAALGGIVGTETNPTIGSNSVAIGKGATVLVNDTLALGSGSVADRNVETYTRQAAFIPGATNRDSTWKATQNAISIGDATNGVTRQLTGLAAGSEDTDAVNVAQLNAAYAKALAASGEALKHTTVSAKDDNIIINTMTNKNGSTNYDVALNPVVTVDEVTAEKGTIGGLTIADNSLTKGTTKVVLGGDASQGTGITNGQASLILQDKTVTLIGATGVDGDVSVHGNVTAKTASLGNVKLDGGIASGTDFTTTYKGNTVSLNDVYNRTSHIKRTDDYTTLIGDTVAVRAVGGTHKGGLFLKGIVDGNTVTMTQFLEDGSAVIGKVGIKADGKITGVAAGIGDTDAVNVSQLKSYAGSAKTEVKAADGETNITVEKTTGANGQDIYSVALQKQLDLTTDGSISFGSGNSLSAAGLTIHNNTYITKEGINASGQNITNVADGTAPTDAVNKGQLDAVGDKVTGLDNSAVKWDEGTKDTIHGVQVSDGKVTANNGISAGNGNFNVDDKGNLNIGNGKFTVDAETGNTSIGGKLNVNGGLTVNGKDVATSENVDKINKKLGSGEFTNGKETYTDAINQNTADIAQNKTDIATNKGNIGDVAKYKDAGIELDGKTVTNVVDATISNKQAITAVDTKVGDGKLDSGASNLTEGINQNYQAIQDNSKAIGVLGSAVNKLDTRVNRVGAGAAALAALQPLDYDPENKWDFAAGYGNYGGASAVAIGTYYRPNETTLLSLGGSFGGGENMVNAGLAVKIGAGQSGRRMVRKELSQEITALREIINSQAAANEQQNAEIAVLKEIIEELKQNH